MEKWKSMQYLHTHIQTCACVIYSCLKKAHACMCHIYMKKGFNQHIDFTTFFNPNLSDAEKISSNLRLFCNFTGSWEQNSIKQIEESILETSHLFLSFSITSVGNDLRGRRYSEAANVFVYFWRWNFFSLTWIWTLGFLGILELFQ